MRLYEITHTFIMNYIQKLLQKFKTRFEDTHQPEEKGYLRYRLTIGEYDNFLDGQERDEFIKRELERNGFLIGEEIMIYRGMNNPYVLFEQRR